MQKAVLMYIVETNCGRKYVFKTPDGKMLTITVSKLVCDG